MMSILVFSCEIGAREYIPRIALGMELANFGYTTIVAHKFSAANLISQLGHVKEGLFVHKDASSDAGRYFGHAKQLGYLVAGCDEEFLNVNVDKLEDDKALVNPKNKGIADFFFASSENTAEMGRKNGFEPVLLGNLRIGLCEVLSPYVRVKLKDIRPPGGAGVDSVRRVILNSPCGMFFGSYPLFNQYEIRTRVVEKDKKSSLRVISQYIDHEVSLYEDIYEIVESLAMSKRITLRAHPGENPEGLKILLSEFAERITIDAAKGSFIMEMLHHDLMLGFDCTTHLECFALGKKSSFFPSKSATASALLDNLTSKHFTPLTISDFLASGGELHSSIKNVDELRKTLLLPGIFSRWIGFFRDLFPSPEKHPAPFIANFKDLYPSAHPDVARRRSKIYSQEVELLWQILVSLGRVSKKCKVRLLSPDAIAIGPESSV